MTRMVCLCRDTGTLVSQFIWCISMHVNRDWQGEKCGFLRIENPCVAGSIPALTTLNKSRHLPAEDVREKPGLVTADGLS